ncbi:MAG: type II toxin-antitoxin system VapC family toxin [Ignavibacteriae bacterium]|nr:type II toxin-antitoxin system VapC family toxin [Ignavibacteriota bacterium]
MKLLLDSHALLWFFNGDEKLSTTARAEIENKSNIKFVSSASIWEMAIKIHLKKLSFSSDVQGILSLIRQNGFAVLQLESEHFIHLTTLPFYHRDPFDRMIITQAICEDMTIVTKDKQFTPYEVKILWD